jgi:hypothetical protein
MSKLTFFFHSCYHRKRAEGICDIVIIMTNTQSKPIANKVAERIQSHVNLFHLLSLLKGQLRLQQKRKAQITMV